MTAAAAAVYEVLPLARLKPASDNPRRDVGDVAELAASIKECGLLEPLVVTPNGRGYIVVCGHRRYAAAKKAGLAEVPAIVREFADDAARVEAMLVENIQRTDLTPVEEAETYRRLIDLGHSQRDLAQRIGRSQSHLSKRLALLDIPEAARKAVDSGRITLEDAAELAKLKATPKRMAAAWKASGGRSGSIEWAVRHELAAQEAERKIQAARERLQRASVRVIEFIEDRYGRRELPAGVRVIQKGGGYTRWGRGDPLAIDPKTHANQECHAAIIVADSGYNAGEVIYVCTRPANHPAAVKNAGRAKTGGQRSAKRIAHEKALREAAARRRAFVGGVATQRHPATGTITALLVDALLARVGENVVKIAAQILGLTASRQALAEHAAASTAKTTAVGLALSFAVREDSIASTWTTWTRDQPYFDLLAAHGYDISDAEKLELAGKAPRPSY